MKIRNIFYLIVAILTISLTVNCGGESGHNSEEGGAVGGASAYECPLGENAPRIDSRENASLVEMAVGAIFTRAYSAIYGTGEEGSVTVVDGEETMGGCISGGRCVINERSDEHFTAMAISCSSYSNQYFNMEGDNYNVLIDGDISFAVQPGNILSVSGNTMITINGEAYCASIETTTTFVSNTEVVYSGTIGNFSFDYTCTTGDNGQTCVDN